MNEIYDKIERVPKNSRIEMVWYKDKVKAVFSELVNNSINFEIKKASDNLCSVLIIKT